jgi:hypothetical protein
MRRYRALRESGDHRRNILAILSKLLSESTLQLRIFHPDHYRARCDRERRQTPAHWQTRPNAPGYHLAQVSQIGRMPHSRANPCGYEPVVARIGPPLRQASELRPAEVRSGTGIEKNADREQTYRRDPTPPCGNEPGLCGVSRGYAFQREEACQRCEPFPFRGEALPFSSGWGFIPWCKAVLPPAVAASAASSGTFPAAPATTSQWLHQVFLRCHCSSA